jgi:signal peptidase I
MADDPISLPSPQSAIPPGPPPNAQITAEPADGRRITVAPPARGGAPSYLRQSLAVLLVTLITPGLYYLAFLLAGAWAEERFLELWAVVTAGQLVAFLALEWNFWLSRSLGLYVRPGALSWVSAALFWLFGPIGLLFRTTESAAEAANGRQALPAPSERSEISLMAGWLVGLVLMLACGWGLWILGAYLDHRFAARDLGAGFGLASLLSLALFLLLERDHRLSRLMGLRIAPNSPGWRSALLDFLLGFVGLLFRSTAPRQAPATAAAPSVNGKGRTQAPPQAADSAREVVETVVFVVVLVLLLKSFTAEAFVIPTGSMAETLLGYNKTVKCPKCGIEFPVNCSPQVDPSDGQPPTFVSGCTCPNCRQRIHLASPEEPRAHLPHDVAEIADPGYGSGDRVLVAKFVYDLLDRPPDRLDVVVFKYPGDEKFPAAGPMKRHTPMNYIKRLIGLPGETIAIHRGKLYYLGEKAGLGYDDVENAAGDRNKLVQLWRAEYMHRDDKEARKRFNDGEFQIIRKPPEVLLAMKRLVYDNDHPARDLTGRQWQRWLADADGVWADVGKNSFRGEGNDEERWLRYRHVLRDAPDQPQLITDFMGYNSWEGAEGKHSSPGGNWASDLILECQAKVERADGELTLEVSKGPDRFQARFDFGSGACTLYRLTGAGKTADKVENLGSADARVKGKGTYRLRLANVDNKLTVWVDNRLPFDGGGVVYKSSRDVVPTEANDLKRPASVGVKKAGVVVSKLKLYRDTYYTTGRGGSPSNPDVAELKPTDPATWGDLADAPVATFYVQPDHYLCLGDNSPESSDGRSWGLVPRRLLLGRALLVYYPFGRAGRIR